MTLKFFVTPKSLQWIKTWATNYENVRQQIPDDALNETLDDYMEREEAWYDSAGNGSWAPFTPATKGYRARLLNAGVSFALNGNASGPLVVRVTGALRETMLDPTKEVSYVEDLEPPMKLGEAPESHTHMTGNLFTEFHRGGFHEWTFTPMDDRYEAQNADRQLLFPDWDRGAEAVVGKLGSSVFRKLFDPWL